MNTDTLHCGRLFVIRPFGVKKDADGREIDFEEIHETLIAPAGKNAGLAGTTTIEIVDAGNIREDMFSLIAEADVVICDVTLPNANVFYELGIRHALRKRRTLLIKGQPAAEHIPFDLLTDRYLSFDLASPGAAEDALTEMLRASLESERHTDSPVFRLLPDLVEINWAEMFSLPLKIREEIEHATVRKDEAQLQAIIDECSGQRFHWAGMRSIGDALWNLEAYDAAKNVWEQIRKTYPHDIQANEALATIYERLSRTPHRDATLASSGEEANRLEGEADALLLSSDHAIERLLANKALSPKQRIEALTLKGRNQKTRWTRRFASVEPLQKRRHAAVSRALISAYEAYRDAYFEDLNAYYPGINSAFLAYLLADFTEEDQWFSLFDSDAAAETCATQLEIEKKELGIMVNRAIILALNRGAARGSKPEEMVWDKLSKADLLFLQQPNRTPRIIAAYDDALSGAPKRARESAMAQVALARKLGFQSEAAEEILQHFEA